MQSIAQVVIFFNFTEVEVKIFSLVKVSNLDKAFKEIRYIGKGLIDRQTLNIAKRNPT